jgi:hypothetical protein
MPTLTITYDMNTIKADFFEDESVRDVYERLDTEYSLAEVPYELTLKDVHGWEDYTQYFNDAFWPTLKANFTDDQIAYWNYAGKIDFAASLANSEEALRTLISKDQQAHFEANKDKHVAPDTPEDITEGDA